MSGPRVVVHLGAPFTGTAGLLRTFDRHRDMLAQRGLALLLPVDLRSPEATGLGATALQAGARGLVISVEAALGPAGRKGFYDGACDSLAAYLAPLQPWPVTLALAVRHPLNWLLARYTQTARRDAQPPEAFFARHTPESVDWSGLARRLAELPQIDSLCLWRCEDHATDLSAVTQALTGQRLPGRAMPPRGLSISAVEAIAAGQPPEDACQAYPLGPFPRFDPFGADVWSEADLAYNRQWAALAHMPKTQRLSAAKP